VKLCRSVGEAAPQRLVGLSVKLWSGLLSMAARTRAYLARSCLNWWGDNVFELISRRYQNKSTLVTTNRPFAEWREVFPNAACVVSLVDRLVHNAEIIAIEGDSYRLKEARERADQRSRQRRGTRS
jgi:hypothetical protein